VRLEISKALSMGKLVAPILVDGASAPNMNALPPDIRGMMRTNIPRLDGGRQFLDNIERIVTALPNALAHHAQVQSVSMDEAEHILETQDSEMPFFPANTSDSVDDISSPVKSSPIPPPAPAPRAPARESSNASRFPISSRKRGEDADDISALPTTEPTPVKRQVAVYAVEQDHELLQHIEQDLTSLGLDVLVNESAQEANLTVIVLSPEAKYSDRMHEEIARLQSQGLPMLSVLGAGDSSSALPYSIAANQTIDLRDYDANRSTLIAAVQAFI
jgi:hypothetical protein